jgi:hypothetical protein
VKCFGTCAGGIATANLTIDGVTPTKAYDANALPVSNGGITVYVSLLFCNILTRSYNKVHSIESHF